MDAVNTVVIDCGTRVCKVGFSGADRPQETYPSVIGQPRHCQSHTFQKFIGHAALQRRGLYALRYPVEHGIITDWDSAEDLMSHGYEQLQTRPEEQAVLIIDSAFSSRSYREKLTQIMFEHFNVPALYIAKQPVMSLFAAGKKTGLAIDAGANRCNVVPVYEGCIISHGMKQSSLGGLDITDYMIKLLTERGYPLLVTSDRSPFQNMTESVGYVSQNYEQDLKTAKETTYESPEGFVITFGEEPFKCTEPLFDPPQIGKDCDGIHQMAYQSIMQSDEEIRAELFQNIVVGGGPSLFPGFMERVQKEMNALVPDGMEAKVISAGTERQFSSWFGGSMFASLPSFHEMCIPLVDYNEHGPSLHRLCM